MKEARMSNAKISNYQFTIFNEFSKGEIFKHWNIEALIGN